MNSYDWYSILKSDHLKHWMAHSSLKEDEPFFRHSILDHTSTHLECWWCKLLIHNSAYLQSSHQPPI